MAVSDNMLIREGLQELRRRLPPGWAASEPRASATGTTVEVAAPDRRVGTFALEARPRLDPKGVRPLVESLVGSRARRASSGSRARRRRS